MAAPVESNKTDLPLALTVEFEPHGICIASVGGEVDAHNTPALRARLQDAIEHGQVSHLVIDLAQATFLDSSALGVLIGAFKRMRERDGSLDVVVPASPIRRIFEVTALDRVLELHESRAEALASAGSAPG